MTPHSARDRAPAADVDPAPRRDRRPAWTCLATCSGRFVANATAARGVKTLFAWAGVTVIGYVPAGVKADVSIVRPTVAPAGAWTDENEAVPS